MKEKRLVATKCEGRLKRESHAGVQCLVLSAHPSDQGPNNGDGWISRLGELEPRLKQRLN